MRMYSALHYISSHICAKKNFVDYLDSLICERKKKMINLAAKLERKHCQKSIDIWKEI